MDQTLINIALTVSMAVGSLIMGGIGWFANTLWSKLQDLERRQNSHEVKVAGEYVSSRELADVLTDIKEVMATMASEVRQDMHYIRNRIDGMPQRRQDDRP